MYLDTGDHVTARGSYDGMTLWVDKLKIGKRDDGEIEVEGRIQSLLADGFVITIQDACDFIVLIDENTEIDGALMIGDFVEVEGMLTEDTAILAFEVEIDDDDDDDDNDDD